MNGNYLIVITFDETFATLRRRHYLVIFEVSHVSDEIEPVNHNSGMADYCLSLDWTLDKKSGAVIM